MKRLLRPSLVAVCILLAPLPAHAQESGQETADPARFAAAQQLVLKIVPDGAFAKIMNGLSEQMGSMIVTQLDAMPIGKIAEAMGLSAADAAKLDKVKISEINTIVDPYYKERTERTMKAMFASMGGVMGKLEPTMREALAHAYARRFTRAQLDEINAFAATPTGALFARSNMELASDPEYLKVNQKLMPELLKEMPAIIASAQKATADLPPVRSYKDLTAADKKKLQALIGS
jgi:hypothetical protein